MAIGIQHRLEGDLRGFTSEFARVPGMPTEDSCTFHDRVERVAPAIAAYVGDVLRKLNESGGGYILDREVVNDGELYASFLTKIGRYFRDPSSISMLVNLIRSTDSSLLRKSTSDMGRILRHDRLCGSMMALNNIDRSVQTMAIPLKHKQVCRRDGCVEREGYVGELLDEFGPFEGVSQILGSLNGNGMSVSKKVSYGSFGGEVNKDNGILIFDTGKSLVVFDARKVAGGDLKKADFNSLKVSGVVREFTNLEDLVVTVFRMHFSSEMLDSLERRRRPYFF